MASEQTTRIAEGTTEPISARLRQLLITTMQIIVVIAGLTVIAWFGTHSDCNGYWGFNEQGALVCLRAAE